LKIDNTLVKKYTELLMKNNRIEKHLYDKYNVKRGLRNQDGTGVLVGLTEIGDVHSYIMDEGDKIPVEGRLFYRGIDVYDLVKGIHNDKRFGFEECAYLLLFGELPTKQELEEFENLLGRNRQLPHNFAEDTIFKVPSSDIMNMLARGVLVLYSYDENSEDLSVGHHVEQCTQLIAKLPTLAAYAYQAKMHYFKNGSLHIHYPKAELSTAESLLHMIRPDSNFTRLEAEMLDLMLILHAEHGGGNNSTFVTHVISSTGTDIYSAISAALGSLKGPLHGGANAKVLDMFDNIKENVKDWDDQDEISHYLRKIMAKKAFDRRGLIYGMGHAVYTLSDPRAVLIKEKAEELARSKGMSKEFNLYSTVEKLAPAIINESKHSNKPICANVDFYSGFVYRMLGIPFDLYTPLFAVGRIAGWCAHRIEEVMCGGKIIRPAYKNVCGRRKYVELNKR
jgi:citrate synthase